MLWVLNQIVVPLIVIGLLIFFHELGHFLFAKFFKVGVVKFSVGFGPALFKFRRQETLYQLCAIPLGGFVRMVGDIPDMITGEQPTDDAVRGESEENTDDTESGGGEIPPELEAVISDRSRWFIEKGFWQRSAIVFAGPLFNFVLAAVLVFFAVLIYGEEQIESAAKIGSVSSGSPAESAGLKPGDVITRIDGKEIASWNVMAETIHGGSGEPITLRLERDGAQEELVVTPEEKEYRGYTGEPRTAFFVGIGPSTHKVRKGLGAAVHFGLLWTADKTILTYMGLWGMLTGQVSPKDLAGPLFIIDTAGKTAEQGLEHLIYFMALLSVSLAVLNLLPIPVLDGGHLMFFLIEALAGPVSMRKKEFAQSVGLLLLIGLMVFAIHNDISRDTESLKSGVAWESDTTQHDAGQPGAD